MADYKAMPREISPCLSIKKITATRDTTESPERKPANLPKEPEALRIDKTKITLTKISPPLQWCHTKKWHQTKS